MQRIWRVMLPCLVVLLGCWSPSLGAGLEVHKDADGIRITGKRPPTPVQPAPVSAPPNSPEAPEAPEAGDAPASPDAPPKSPPVVAPEKSGDQAGPVPLEENPAFVEALNALTDEYRRREALLQERADRELADHDAGTLALRNRILAVEAAMERDSRTDAIYAYQEREQERARLLREMAAWQAVWQEQAAALERESQRLYGWYEQQSKRLRWRFERDARR